MSLENIYIYNQNPITNVYLLKHTKPSTPSKATITIASVAPSFADGSYSRSSMVYGSPSRPSHSLYDFHIAPSNLPSHRITHCS